MKSVRLTMPITFWKSIVGSFHLLRCMYDHHQVHCRLRTTFACPWKRSHFFWLPVIFPDSKQIKTKTSATVRIQLKTFYFVANFVRKFEWLKQTFEIVKTPFYSLNGKETVWQGQIFFWPKLKSIVLKFRSRSWKNLFSNLPWTFFFFEGVWSSPRVFENPVPGPVFFCNLHHHRDNNRVWARFGQN